MFGLRKAPTGCNFVHSDEIWKDHVSRELQASRRWPEKWGVLASHYQSSRILPREVKRSSGVAECATAVAGGPLLSPIQNSDAPVKDANPQHKLIKACPGHPETTAREVGLRQAQFPLVEMYGRSARGQHSIDKQLNWPREGIM